MLLPQVQHQLRFQAHSPEFEDGDGLSPPPLQSGLPEGFRVYVERVQDLQDPEVERRPGASDGGVDSKGKGGVGTGVQGECLQKQAENKM